MVADSVPKFEREAQEIIDNALAQVKEKGLNPAEVFQETVEKLKQHQEDVRLYWKGGGPDIREYMASALAEAFPDVFQN